MAIKFHLYDDATGESLVGTAPAGSTSIVVNTMITPALELRGVNGVGIVVGPDSIDGELLQLDISAIELTARVVATSNLSLTGAATVDSTVLSTGDVVLAAAQTTASQNGLWIVNTSGAWTRPSGWVPIPNQRIAIRVGSANATMVDTIWHLTNDTAPVVGTDAQTWKRLDTRAVTHGGINAAVTLNKHTFPRLHVFITASANPGFSITLPSAADYAHGEIVFKATFAGLAPANKVTLLPPGTETIDGAANHLLQSAYASRRLVSNGSNWYIVG